MNNQQQPIILEDADVCNAELLSTKHHPVKATYIDRDGKAQPVKDHLATVKALREKKPNQHMSNLIKGIDDVVKTDPMAGLFDPHLVREGKETYGFGLAPKRKPILLAIVTAYPYISRQSRIRREMVQMAVDADRERARMRASLINSIKHGKPA